MTLLSGFYALRASAARRLPAKLMHGYRILRHVWLTPFEPELALLPRFLDRNAVAIDIGANVGIYAHLLARGSKRVIAFEPHPDFADYLRRLALDRVEVSQAAVSASIGEAILRVPRDAGRSSLSPANALDGDDERSIRSEQVTTVTLDQIGDRVAAVGERAAFVKIDVEGHELEVLSGGRRFLATQRPVLLIEIEYRHGGDPRAVFGLLAELGYDAYALSERGALAPIDPRQLAASQTPELMRFGRHGGYLSNVFFIQQHDQQVG